MIQYIGPKGHNMPVANGNNIPMDVRIRMLQQAKEGRRREQEAKQTKANSSN